MQLKLFKKGHLLTQTPLHNGKSYRCVFDTIFLLFSQISFREYRNFRNSQPVCLNEQTIGVEEVNK